MKTGKRLITPVRQGLAAIALAMLCTLPAARAWETFPAEAGRNESGGTAGRADCAGAVTNGSGSGVTFTLASGDPTGVRFASVAWGDYDKDGDLDILLAGDTDSDYVTEVWRNEGSDTFTQASTDPTGVRFASVAWGDYDDDGDLDILLAGDTGSGRVTEVWRDEGSGTFTQTVTLTDVSDGGVAWGDYDDDGDLDILLAGYTGSDRVTEVWRNEGSDTFTQTVTALTGVSGGSVAWGDYDDDGDLDILLAGISSSGRVTEVWRNDGSDTFVQTVATPTAVSLADVAWGDYDNDGDLDILLAGNAGSDRVTEVWRNEGSDTFIQASGDPIGVINGSVAWGDYDNDGDLDILLAGYAGNDPGVTEVWRNEGSDTFTQTVTLTGVSYGGVAWGDYDDDGDLDVLLAGNMTTEVWRNEGFRVFLPSLMRSY
jgi:predicted nucleotidyltransferase